jgi:LemA protein
MNPVFIVLGVIGVIVVYLFFLYNGLITVKMRVKEAWSQIDIQLKRRADLIPNLVETVKGYAKHEKTLLENITKARSAMMQATSLSKKAEANNQITESLKSLFAVAENYPQLKANENFLQLQQELGDTEDKVAYSRQFYNTAALEYNTMIAVLPTVLIARQLGFGPEEFFQATDEEKKKVTVNFS